MAFDIYVGSASRYFAGNWKTIVQQAAEADGIAYQVVRPTPSPLSKIFQPKPEKAYRDFLNGIKKETDFQGNGEPLWNDSPELDYVTDRPAWEGHYGLLIKYAYLMQPELTPPATLPKALEEEPTYQAALRTPDPRIRQLAFGEIFIPTALKIMFVGKTIGGVDVPICSLGLLDWALRHICELWGTDRTLVGALELDQHDRDAPLDVAALFGLSIYCRLLDEARSRYLPLIKDY